MRSFKLVFQAVLWIVAGITGCSALGIYSQVCDAAADTILSGKALVPLTRFETLSIGMGIDLMGLILLIGLVIHGVYCLGRAGENIRLAHPKPFLGDFF